MKTGEAKKKIYVFLKIDQTKKISWGLAPADLFKIFLWSQTGVMTYPCCPPSVGYIAGVKRLEMAAVQTENTTSHNDSGGCSAVFLLEFSQLFAAVSSQPTLISDISVFTPPRRWRSRLLAFCFWMVISQERFEGMMRWIEGHCDLTENTCFGHNLIRNNLIPYKSGQTYM